MKILSILWYYKPANVYGGPISSMSTMLEGLASRGNDVTVFTTNANGCGKLNVPLNQMVIINNVKVKYFPVTIDKFSVNFSMNMSREMKKIKEYDLIISGLLWHPILVDFIRINCRKFQVPYIIPLFGQLMPWAMGQKRWKKLFFYYLFARNYLNSSSALQCTSEIEQDAVRRLKLSAPTILIPHRIDKSLFSTLPFRGFFRSKLGIKQNDFVLLFLGRLHQVKRPDLAVEILININKPNIHIIFAGPDEGGFIEKLERRLKMKEIIQQVHFVGNIEKSNLPQLFSDSDLLIMPSEQENFGNSAAEALMAGLPILTSKNVPVGLQAASNDAGKVADLSVESFVIEIRKLLASSKELKAMGKRGKKFAEQNFDRTALDNLVNYYKEIINKNIY